jgi:O-glycosyl hydrolase
LDSAKKHQKIIGFGGITTPPAYHQLSEKGKEQWWKILAEYRLLIHREYPIGTQLKKDLSNWDDLDDAVPHYYGDNFPNSEISDFNYIKTIRKIGGMVWFEFWELPGWMKQDWTDSKGQLHRGVANPEIYAGTVVNYCQKSLDKAGMPPDIVGIQNEKLQPPEIWHQMTLKLRQALDKAGFRKVKIHMTDCSSAGGAHTWVNWYKNSEAAWKTIDYAATHMYDYQGYFTRPDEFDSVLRILKERIAEKPLLSTELCINWPDKQILSYRSAFTMGQLYHKNLVISNASAICYCWLLLNVTQPSFGWTRSLLVPDKANGFVPKASSYQLRVFGAFSRRIKRDMVRIDAISSDNDILASGFVSNDGCQTVVLLNRSLESRLVSVTGTQQQFRWIEITDPYKENEIRKLNPGSKKEANEVLVEPGAIVTLTNVALGQLPRDFAVRKN